MTFGQPVNDAEGLRYVAYVRHDSGAAFTISTEAAGNYNDEPAFDSAFQALVDVLDGAQGFSVPDGGTFKHRADVIQVTPTRSAG